jgi:3,4-dihydroxy-2-butanone 4-phosphate synthase
MNQSFSSIDTALTHFTNGGLLVVVDDESRENEGDIVFSAALSTPEKVIF